MCECPVWTGRQVLAGTQYSAKKAMANAFTSHGKYLRVVIASQAEV